MRSVSPARRTRCTVRGNTNLGLRNVKKESVALEVIKANYPDTETKVNLCEVHGLVKDHGIPITMETVAKLLDANGYIRKRKGMTNEQ